MQTTLGGMMNAAASVLLTTGLSGRSIKVRLGAPLACILSILLVAAELPQATAETLKFKSEVKPEKYTATIGGELSFPQGSGPFPVVIFLHACGGLDRFAQASFAAHGRALMKSGFATFTLDSFSARSLQGGKICDPGPLGSEA